MTQRAEAIGYDFFPNAAAKASAMALPCGFCCAGFAPLAVLAGARFGCRGLRESAGLRVSRCSPALSSKCMLSEMRLRSSSTDITLAFTRSPV